MEESEYAASGKQHVSETLRRDGQNSVTSQVSNRSCTFPQNAFSGVCMRTYTIQTRKYRTKTLSKLKFCTCDSSIRKQRTHPQFSLNAEVNNDMKYPFEICIYHLQEALPNNQWQLG